MGLAEGCKLKHDLQKDQAMRYEDIFLPPDKFL